MKWTVLAILLLVGLKAGAADFYDPAEDEGKEPLHLIPLSSGGETRYELAAEKMGLKGAMIAKVVIIRPLSGNECVTVRERKDDSGGVTYEMVAAYQNYGADGKLAAAETKTRKIGKELAVQVQRVWARAVLDGRPNTGARLKSVSDPCSYGLSATVKDSSPWAETVSPDEAKDSIPGNLVLAISVMQSFMSDAKHDEAVLLKYLKGLEDKIAVRS